MKIKLISPIITKSDYERKVMFPPLSIASLAAYLKKYGYKVEQEDLLIKVRINDSKIRYLLKAFNNFNLRFILDYLMDKHESDLLDAFSSEVLRNIEYKGFNLIGFSIIDKFTLLFSLVISKKIKVHSNAKIVLGGPFINVFNKEVLSNFEFIDYLVRGEGEIPLLNLVKFLNNEKDSLRDVSGLIFKDSKKIVANDSILQEVDHLPAPYFEEDDMKYYQNNFDLVGKKGGVILPYEMSKGCTNKCIFCGAFSKLRIKNVYKVVEELKILKNKYKTKYFYFTDNAINQSTQFLVLFCDLLIKNKLDIEWMVLAKPQGLDKRLLNKIHKAGCRILIYGIESGSQKILNKMRKGWDVVEMSSILKNAVEAGILNYISLIVDYPYETKNDFTETINFVENNSEYITNSYFDSFVLLNNSILHNYPEENGIKIIKPTRDDIYTKLRDFNDMRFNELNGLSWDKKRDEQLNRVGFLRAKMRDLGIRVGEPSL